VKGNLGFFETIDQIAAAKWACLLFSVTFSFFPMAGCGWLIDQGPLSLMTWSGQFSTCVWFHVGLRPNYSVRFVFPCLLGSWT
jgi:hypothetical protein